MSVAVRPLGFGRDARPFIRFLWRIYRRDPAWIPPLRRTLAQQLDPKHNPFLRYGEAQLFVAERDGEVVGRISAQINPHHDQFHHERGGFFGFFECVDDPSVARTLFEAAEHWLRARNVDWVRGPLSFTINDEVGIPLDHFDQPPMVAMPHGRDYYAALIEGAGYRKVKDVVSWSYPLVALPDRLGRARDAVLAQPDVSVREFDRRRFKRDVRVAVEIFNEAWAENWGFVPISGAEADRLGNDLVQFADPKITAFYEVAGELAGMVVAIPNLNEAARDVNGRLFPLGALKIKWRLWRGLRSGRVILLGLRPDFRRRDLIGLPLALLAEIHVRGKARGYERAELGWVLEDNHLLINSLERTDARPDRTYRIYQKSAAGAGGPLP